MFKGYSRDQWVKFFTLLIVGSVLYSFYGIQSGREFGLILLELVQVAGISMIVAAILEAADRKGLEK